MNNNIKIILLFCLAGLLAACNGGSGGRGNAGTTNQSTTSTSPAPSQTSKARVSSSNTSAYTPTPNNTTDTNTGRLITIRWNIPTSREDGTSLLAREINRYEIYYFREDAPGSNGTVITVNDPAITSINFNLPAPGTYYFAIASVDTLGVYSDVSDPLSLLIP